MTEKQIERVKKKIEKFKKALAADKKYWGGFHHDGQGIRYTLPGLYIQTEDFKGGLRYLNWFNKTFPEDVGNALFLFEWAFILFKNGKLDEARRKVFSTFFSNIFVFDKFLESEPSVLIDLKDSEWERETIQKYFHYSKHSEGFEEFAHWIQGVLNSKAFFEDSKEYLEIRKELESEPVGEKRTQLVKRLGKIQYG